MKKGDITIDPEGITRFKRRCYEQFYANKFHIGMTNLKNTGYQD